MKNDIFRQKCDSEQKEWRVDRHESDGRHLTCHLKWQSSFRSGNIECLSWRHGNRHLSLKAWRVARHQGWHSSFGHDFRIFYIFSAIIHKNNSKYIRWATKHTRINLDSCTIEISLTNLFNTSFQSRIQ